MTLPELPESVVRWLTGNGVRIAVIAALAWIAMRLTAAGARRFERGISTGNSLDEGERRKRVQTLTRTVQKTLAILVASMAVLMILRELGLDITPVLTGAGVAGLAIGFGAQTLVRDVISGFFLIVEDQVRVGDVAIVNGQGGLVEELNLRTIVLRDFDGTVHVFPNGEVKTLANRSKDYSFYVLTVALRADEDVDRLAGILRETAGTLTEDPVLQSYILEPIEIVGVDDFVGGQLVVKARIKTLPLRQWDVGRELRKRLALRLASEGIDLPASRVDVRIDGLAELLKALGPRD